MRHTLLGMFVTKQAEQEIYFIAQKKLRWCSPPKKLIHTQLSKLAVGALSYLSGVMAIVDTVSISMFL